jgi:membrane protease YdiL (CAAX protease family)
MDDAPDPPDVGGTALPSGASIAAPAAPRSRRELWFELAVVLAIGFFPNLAAAVTNLAEPPARYMAYWVDSVYFGVTSACTVVPVLYLMGRSGEPWARFGVVRPHAWDALLGLFLACVASLIWRVLPPLPDIWPRPGGYFPRPAGGADYAMMVVKFALGGLAEELVYRAYLIPRLGTLLRSRGEALLGGALLFSAVHVYQGPPGLAFSLAFGLVYGVVFLVIGRVWPLAVGHALYNCYLDLLPA